MSGKMGAFSQLVEPCALPHRVSRDIEDYWWPLARDVAGLPKPAIVGIGGAQGSGKSTLSRVLQGLLGQGYGLQVATLSLDDLYYPLAHRRWMARHVHPLLSTRGVPGTHDVTLGLELIRRFRCGQDLRLPRFDKGRDDRCLHTEWLQGPVDVLIFEGWCLAATAQDEGALARPVNSLEAQQDTDGRWRHHVNQCLAGPYQKLFAQIDKLVYLQAPDWPTVIRWRQEQEHKRMMETGQGMDDAALSSFMLHFQRITEHQLVHGPVNAQVYRLDEQRQVSRVDERGKHDYVI